MHMLKQSFFFLYKHAAEDIITCHAEPKAKHLAYEKITSLIEVT